MVDIVVKLSQNVSKVMSFFSPLQKPVSRLALQCREATPVSLYEPELAVSWRREKKKVHTLIFLLPRSNKTLNRILLYASKLTQG